MPENWELVLEIKNMSFKCHFCTSCKGNGCRGEMPGMGGVDDSSNFILNCKDWSYIRKDSFTNSKINIDIRLAPITGAVENIGYPDEKQFYFDLMASVYNQGYKLSIGDGTPDFKLQYGIEAVHSLAEKDSSVKAAVFIKPYSNFKIMERMEQSSVIAELAGIDIDSYNIITMRSLVQLEKKTPSQLKEIKDFLNKKGLPFALKGIFTKEDISICQEVKPDIIYISNHGGRVDTVKGSTASFLKQHYNTLKDYCDKLWIDGGIRSRSDILTAQSYGIDTVLLGRPFITALCQKETLKL